MLRFLIPGYYLFYSRLKSNFEKISWFIIYVIPIYIIGLSYTKDDLFIYSIIFVLAVLIFNSIYEIGYIENDTRTILKERQPTLRLAADEYKLFEKHYLRIILYKILIAIVLLLIAQVASLLYSADIYTVQFFVVLVIVRILFFLHNNIRGRVNIASFFLLAVVKYSAPLCMLIPSENILAVFTMTLFLFPLLRTMEHATKTKYGFKSWTIFVGNHDLFRLKYYGLMLLLGLGIMMFFEYALSTLGVMLLSYFLIYRVGSYLIVRKNLYTRINR